MAAPVVMVGLVCLISLLVVEGVVGGGGGKNGRY